MSAPEVRRSPIEGRGLFVTCDQPAGSILTTYFGPVLAEPPPPDAEGRIHGLELEPGKWIDGSGDDNLARFANHSCDPSAEAVRDGTVVHLQARRPLRSGEEVTFDYGYGLADAPGHPCRCGTTGCPGLIVAEPLRPILRRLRLNRKPRD